MTNYVNRLCFDLLARLGTDKKLDQPVLFSSYSLVNVLVSLFYGTSGETQTNMKEVFGFEGKITTISLLNSLKKDLNQLNSIREYNIIAFFDLMKLRKSYYKTIKSISNFTRFNKYNSREIEKKINSDINKITEGLIQNVLQKNSLKNSVIVLTNTVFFYSNWKIPFDKEKTKLKKFYFSGEKYRKIDMMIAEKRQISYFENKLGKLVELEFSEKDIVFGIFLPDENKLPLIEKENLNLMITNLKSTKLEFIKIPRFEEESKLSFNNTFKKMGLDIFNKCDLSGMTKSKERLFVSEIYQKTKIIINETGVKAASSTTLKIKSKSKSPSNPFKFVANKPFLYYIRYSKKNVFLFMGIYK